ncbi:MAG: hypothetical protein NZ529_03735 [Cytophagaceae bacterium]|nr:hypothetical protein [Cytophagaceae bacterium]MDW8455882.1 hypothetical protein [Cytophagaceae bacterium]
MKNLIIKFINFKRKLYHIAFIVICMFACSKCAQDYIYGANEKLIAQYEKMIKDNSKTTAVLDSVYTEYSLKGSKTAFSYNFNYYFTVDGVKYKGNHSFNKLPTLPVVEVYYSKEDPNINCLEPTKMIETEKNKSSVSNLYWAIGFGVVGIFATFLFVVNNFTKPKAKQA